MLIALHIGAATRSGTQSSGKINVVPQAGALAVAPVAIATIVYVTKRDRMHKGAVL